MLYFLIIFLIITILIFGLDRYFYITISNILEFKNINSEVVLNSLGYYNKSIFTNKLHGVLLSIFILILIYGLYRYNEKKKQEKYKEKIKKLEDDLIRINGGDYSIDIKEDDEYSSLRDEIYKIIINLKSLEEEAKRQKLTLKKDLSNIAHQLKTPITSIGFMVELINEDRENSDIYLEKLYSELEKLKNFIEVLLKLSKINSNAIEYKFKELSILEIIEDIFNSLNRNRKVNIKYNGEDFYVLGDEVWLYEAFLNIIKNSLEHTLDTVSIELTSNPIYKVVKISDNGSGVEEDILKRIFDRFYRGETSLPGYGIGLNLSKSIIEDHKGDIIAFNDNGLTFEVKFYNVT
ncbi:sensor histidine kinase [Clostridium algidicarnis]|uniref:histidine kinase n=2 Tax=Clostridium algidicarnis TaxID=37659 RepID=A0A2S6FVA7_9CLOT|nr:HAMP domain-containing sensor histidine kinase [Clostridium algidicarnis]MBU3218776.1 HAMP domain-containing histidine kinase [Clostridium algidicarnis]MCB2286095.1 HAMP domain-containing histidine kinase [Clostridium algidicarnis]PPK45922.1 signal transduction histidine kinase [Clostridium algidicarnis DSM 15099]